MACADYGNNAAMNGTVTINHCTVHAAVGVDPSRWTVWKGTVEAVSGGMYGMVAAGAQ